MPNEGLSGNYNFRIEMRNVVEFFGTEFALETSGWIDALKTAKRTQDEIEKSKNITLSRNTDIFVAMYRRKMGEMIDLRINQEADQFMNLNTGEKIGIPDFIEKLEKGNEWLSGVSKNFLFIFLDP